MRKWLFIPFFFLSCSLLSQSTNYWLQAAGSPNVDENMAIAKDNNNNVITVGYFTNTITFPGNTTLTSTSPGVTDVLIQKTDPQGQILWKVKAGGMGSDRAMAVSCDAAGNIYITGHYYGVANFGSFTLNSVNNTQDVFIAKLNSTGTFLWAVSAGGNMWDEPYAINVDQQGNVLVTGEFQGSATFGTQTLNSALNGNGNPSLDIFTAKYDNAGNFQWVRQGSAEFDDRGLDVGADAAGNVFVCGQFSDTITFNQVHNNQIANAVFIIKYSPSGQELWFVRAGATSSIAYGLAVDNSGDLYVTGDYTGNMVFYGSPNNFLFGNYTNRIFLVKYSNAGNYLWGREDASNSYVSSRDVALNPGEEPCLYGEFGCRMDEYSVAAGGTGMFNSVGFKDLFITQYDKNGNRQWMRNWGGAYDDKAHGIVFTNTNMPYMAGSFEYGLVVNSSYNPFNVITANTFGFNGWISTTNCNNQNYYYRGTQSFGFSDCFILHGLDNTCPYYDYYYRNGLGCQLDYVDGCIDDYSYNCSDTLSICPGKVMANPYTGSNGGVGPSYHYQWNTGDTMQWHNMVSSGNYSCVMNSYDGCFKKEDTVYIKVNPKPQPPTITDNFGININQPPLTYSIHVCASTATLTGGNLQGCTYQWTSYLGGGIVSTSGPSCVVNKTDTFYFILTNAFGCKDSNKVYVRLDTLVQVAPKTNMPDSFQVCIGNCFTYFIYDSISNPQGLPYGCSTVNSLSVVVTNNGAVFGQPPCSLSLTICPSVTGWLNLNIMYIFSSLCGKDTVYFQKPIYIKVNPKPNISVSFNGNNFICPGDSTLLIATYTITPLTNIAYTVTPNDSIWATQQGLYSASVYAIDTLTGCFRSNFGQIFVQTKQNPYIYTIPANAIICPGDSVQIICQWQGAVSWQWYGPMGIIPINAASIYDSIPGFYYCVATDNNGCVLTSNTIELKQYNTPYLMGLPSTSACAGQTVTLQVISNDTSLIQWLPPLSGGGTIKNVNTSGTYSCQVTMCGITTVCTINVTISNPVAQIAAQANLTICPGDSVLLTGNGGMSVYMWLPTNQYNDSIYAYASGTYTLMITDGNGCQASDTVSVSYDPNAPPQPLTTNDSICAGTSANLQASTTGNYTIEWYAQQYSGSVINTGTNYTTPPLFQNTTYYVSVMDSTGCHSVRTPADVFIIPSSLPPAIWGDSILCDGDTLHLFTNYLSGATYAWSGPNGFSSAVQSPFIFPATAAATGVYSLFISGGGCTSPVVTHTVIVLDLTKPSITSRDTLCQGASLVLQGQSPDTGIVFNWTGPGGFSCVTAACTIAPVDTNNTGMYLLQTYSGNCKSEIDTVFVFVKLTPYPNASVTGGFCIGDTASLLAQTLSGASTQWTGPSGFSSNIPNPVIFIDSSKAGYYYLTSTLNGCSGKDSVLVKANPLPYFSLGGDTLVCDNEPWVIDPAIGGTYNWSNGSTDTTFIVYNSSQITLTVTNQYGCKYYDTINVVVAQCALKAPNVFTPNGDGINDNFYFGFDHYLELKFIIYDRWGVKVFENRNNENSWDGVNMYSGKPCTEGTYYYIAESKNMKGAIGSSYGFLTLLR